MNQIILETNDSLDLQLLLAFAKRLKVDVVSVKIEHQEVELTDEAIDSQEILHLLQHSTTLDFLKDDAEDIYSDADLKKVY
jgi:hypothetical protein